jgi:hypothetical protein
VGGGGIISYFTGQVGEFPLRLSDTAGAVDTGFAASFDGEVWALLADGAGGVRVGGTFSSVGAQQRLGLAHLGAAGGLGSTPVVGIQHIGAVNAIARQPDGGMIVGGRFDYAGGHPRRNLLRLNPDHTLDLHWQPSVEGEVQALAVGADGAVFVADELHTAHGGFAWTLSRFAGNGPALQPTWQQHPNGPLLALATNAAGGLFAGGGFTEIGGEERICAAMLAGQDGALDPVWNPAANGTVRAMAVDSSGRVYIGGDFYQVGAHLRGRHAKLSGSGSSGSPFAAWTPAASGRVHSLILSNDEQHVFVGGEFGAIGAIPRIRLARIATWGGVAVDAQWNPTVGGASVDALAQLPDGSLIVGGRFMHVGGEPRRNIARVETEGSGSLAAGWSPNPDATVRALVLDAAGQVLAGGGFRRIGEQTREAMAALPVGVAVPPADTQLFRDGFEP